MKKVHTVIFKVFSRAFEDFMFIYIWKQHNPSCKTTFPAKTIQLLLRSLRIHARDQLSNHPKLLWDWHHPKPQNGLLSRKSNDWIRIFLPRHVWQPNKSTLYLYMWIHSTRYFKKGHLLMVSASRRQDGVAMQQNGRLGIMRYQTLNFRILVMNVCMSPKYLVSKRNLKKNHFFHL